MVPMKSKFSESHKSHWILDPPCSKSFPSCSLVQKACESFGVVEFDCIETGLLGLLRPVATIVFSTV